MIAFTNNQKRTILSVCFTAACLLLPASAAPILAASTPPTLRLFPTTVVENIRQTSQSAKDMEQGLQGIISDLEQQMEIYTQSKCQGTEGDQGCAEISKQMGQTYLQMLETMETQLPVMEASVKITRDSLRSRLRSELGRKMTPRELQKHISGQAGPRPPSTTKAGKLSEKFQKYYELVAMGPNPGSGSSLPAVASEIFMDTNEVLKFIALTRDEISRSKLWIELNQIYGVITPEMFKMVAGVKEVIFGESAEGYPKIPGESQVHTNQAYHSPLEQ